jgi:iron complex outermembrane receptor protein
MAGLFRSALAFAGALLVGASSLSAQTGTIAGRVTEKASGEAVPRARIEAFSGTSGSIVSATTRDNGTYTLPNLEPGSYTVTVRARVGLAAQRIPNVIVRAGATTTLDIEALPNPTQLNEVVTTATRGAESEKILDSPNSISVVPEMRITERAAVTVTDHIKGVPGLSISTGGVLQANIVSRGFNNAFSTTMLMLQDYRFAGVPSLRVNVPALFTGTNEDIERIEVLNGPAAALYGPNSGAGVLHVISKSPFNSVGNTITVAGGEQSLGRISGRHAGIFGSGKFGYKLSGEAFTAKDFKYTDPNEPTTYSATDTRIPSSRRGKAVVRDFDLRRYSGEGRLDFRPGENTELISTAGFTQFGKGMEITTTFGAAQVSNWTYMNLQERFRHKNFFAQVFYNKSNSGNDSPTDSEGSYYLRTGIPVVDRSSVLVGQAQQGLTFGRTKLVLGGEYVMTRPQTAGTINGRNEGNDDINEYGGYLQTTTEILPKLDLLLAARGDVNSRIEGSQFSPRAALVFKPSETHNLRATFGRSFNSPASFAFFLDQYSGQTPAPGMPVQILGNPSKQGWTFARSCTGGVAGNLCMRSPYIPNTLAPASAAAAYPGFAASLQAIVTGLPTSSFGTAGEAGRQAILGILSGPVGGIVRGLRPTEAQVSTSLVDLGTRQGVTSVTDYGPLKASFTNTLEFGYKGLIGPRFRLSGDLWFQRRPADPTTQIINPGVLFNGPQLGAYLGTQIATQLIQGGMPAAQAQATATQVAGALTPLMAAIPVGATAFTNPLDDQPYLVFSYREATGNVNVHGFDLAADFLLDGGFSLAATYSNLNKNVFADAPGATAANPLAANAPKHRGTATFRYENEPRGLSAEVRGRYADAFPVNSGVFNSYNVGTPVPYPPVPVNALLDAGFSWVLPVAGAPRWSINGTNLLDNKVQTFVGVPTIGRLLLTQLQYSF